MTSRRRGSPPSARAVRYRMRTRRVRSTTLVQRLGELYERLLYAGVAIGLLVQVARLSEPPTWAESDSSAAALAQWLAVGSAAAGFVLLMKVLLAFGPMVVRSADQTWLFSTPVDRGQLLRPLLLVAVLASGVTGAAIAVVLGVLGGLPLSTRVLVVIGGTCVGMCQGSLAVVVQRYRSLSAVAGPVLNAAFGMLLLGGVVAAIGTPRTAPLSVMASAPPWLTGAVGTAAFAAVVAGAGAWRVLAHLTRRVLAAGVDLSVATASSLAFLDPSVLGAVLLVRRTQTIGVVRSAAIRGSRTAALVKADCTRVLRLRTGPLVWVALLPVPYIAGLLGAGALLPAVHLVAAFIATDRLAGGLRLIYRSAAIRRAVGGSDRQLRLVHLIVPFAGAVVWVGLTTLYMPEFSGLAAAISCVGAVAVTYRLATRPPLDYTSPSFDVGLFGPIPPGLILQLIRGPALLIVLIGVQIWIGTTGAAG